MFKITLTNGIVLKADAMDGARFSSALRKGEMYTLPKGFIINPATVSVIEEYTEKAVPKRPVPVKGPTMKKKPVVKKGTKK